MNRFALILTATALLISGCATTDSKRVDAWKAVALEEQKSEAAKWKSLEALGQGADPHTKDKLAMAWMAASMSAGQKQATPMPAEPESAFDKTLRALTILAPVAGNVGLGIVQAQVAREGIRSNERVQIGDQQARVATVNSVSNGMANLAVQGFNALATVGSKPSATITVNGNQNAVATNGSTASTTATTTTITTNNNCPSGDTGNATATPSGTTTPSATANGGTTGATACNGK